MKFKDPIPDPVYDLLFVTMVTYGSFWLSKRIWKAATLPTINSSSTPR